MVGLDTLQQKKKLMGGRKHEAQCKSIEGLGTKTLKEVLQGGLLEMKRCQYLNNHAGL